MGSLYWLTTVAQTIDAARDARRTAIELRDHRRRLCRITRLLLQESEALCDAIDREVGVTEALRGRTAPVPEKFYLFN